jgi:hypothetical protein
MENSKVTFERLFAVIAQLAKLYDAQNKNRACLLIGPCQMPLNSKRKTPRLYLEDFKYQLNCQIRQNWNLVVNLAEIYSDPFVSQL